MSKHNPGFTSFVLKAKTHLGTKISPKFKTFLYICFIKNQIIVQPHLHVARHSPIARLYSISLTQFDI